ncbi:hypothetical protein COB57_05550 [Candidatus Peregrinibacteria bacterium]|nr:MAG: hypothetical protein COB57_05550 [Candidatus Peregrinibacteria bacterium]
MKEIELKFLNIDVADIKQKLLLLGAEEKYNTEIESQAFLAEGFHSSDSAQKYLRIRKINDLVTITYKSPAHDSEMSSRDEIELQVDSYDNAIGLLESMGFKKGHVGKKHRIHYEYGNVHFELDTLENIPTYLEIETTCEEKMREVCKKLDLNILEGKKGTIVEILPEMFIQT